MNMTLSLLRNTGFILACIKELWENYLTNLFTDPLKRAFLHTSCLHFL